MTSLSLCLLFFLSFCHFYAKSCSASDKIKKKGYASLRIGYEGMEKPMVKGAALCKNNPALSMKNKQLLMHICIGIEGSFT